MKVWGYTMSVKFEIRFIESPNKEVTEINSYEDFQLFLDQSVMELIKNSPPIPYQYDKNNLIKTMISSLNKAEQVVEYADVSDKRDEDKGKTADVESIISFWQSLDVNELEKIAKEGKDADLLGNVRKVNSDNSLMTEQRALHTQSSFQERKIMSNILKRLDYLSKVEEDWDGRGAPPLSKTVKSKFEKLLLRTDYFNTDCGTYLGNNGDLIIDKWNKGFWFTEDRVFIVDLNSNPQEIEMSYWGFIQWLKEVGNEV